jgi:hypothetical protein
MHFCIILSRTTLSCKQYLPVSFPNQIIVSIFVSFIWTACVPSHKPLTSKYCHVFDWRPSLLGNRSRNSSMDTLTTPVLLLAVLKKGRQYTELVLVRRPSKLVYASRSPKLVFVSESSKWDVSAVQFRQRDSRSQEC